MPMSHVVDIVLYPSQDQQLLVRFATTCARNARGVSVTDKLADSLLSASQSIDRSARQRAAVSMVDLLPHCTIRQRLVEMLRDSNLAVQSAAAEALVTRGGPPGLRAVLRDLGARLNDPDADYIVYLLQELQGLRGMPILQQARALAAEDEDQSVHAGLEDLEELFGHYA